MLITFKSKAAADVLMYEEHAAPILSLLHKDPKRGVITAAEADNAIATLEAEVVTKPVQPKETIHDAESSQFDDDERHTKAVAVSLAARVYPLLEMLRAAKGAQTDVMWGV
jgi:hypothetical protein